MQESYRIIRSVGNVDEYTRRGGDSAIGTWVATRPRLTYRLGPLGVRSTAFEFG